MSEEGDEDSFVILGTSPATDLSNNFITGNYANKTNDSNPTSLNNDLTKPSSISNVRSQNSNLSDSSNSKYSVIANDNRSLPNGQNSDSMGRSMNHSHRQNYDSEFSVISHSSNNSGGDAVRMPSFSRMNSENKSKGSIDSGCNNLSLDATNNMPAKEGSLAASFLMGDVQLDVLKATMHTQFPSLCNSSIKSDEMLKLQNVFAEYIELKETLKKNNIAMRKHFTTLQKWQDEVKAQKDEQNKQINVFQETVAKLRNENLDLKKELENKMEQININENVIRKESEQMTKVLSEKTAQIQNMASQIEKLEQQHLDSFEFIRQLKTEKDEVQGKTKEIEHEYVPILEHKRIVSDLEERLSETVAKNLELDEMQDKYKDEIKKLKERLNTCQDELKNAQSDITILKSNDEERKHHFEKYEKERDDMRNEISILKTQVEIYSKDFEMERVARQNLAGEKEKILTDLRLLQQRNQELLENSKKHLESLADANASSQRSTPPRQPDRVSPPSRRDEQIYEPTGFTCPLCNRTFKLLNDLQTHVQDCIDS